MDSQITCVMRLAGLRVIEDFEIVYLKGSASHYTPQFKERILNYLGLYFDREGALNLDRVHICIKAGAVGFQCEYEGRAFTISEGDLLIYNENHTFSFLTNPHAFGDYFLGMLFSA